MALAYVQRRLSIVTGWANKSTFPPKQGVIPGFDPIIGQESDGQSFRPRWMVGAYPNDQGKVLDLPIEWVVPKGGEYFFSPSISALRDIFALA